MTTPNPMLAELDEVVRLVGVFDADINSLDDFQDAAHAAFDFLRTHHSTLADMAKRLEAAERDAVPVSALEALLPGTYYMDPPDGGDAPVYEQLRRMAKDAARYRWLCEFREWPESVEGALDCGNKAVIDAAIDAAIAATQEGEG